MTTRAVFSPALIEEQRFRKLLLTSVALHLALVLALLIAPRARPRLLPPAPIYVEVVPEAAPAPRRARAARQIVKEKVVIPPEPKTVSKPKPKLKPKPKPKLKLKLKPKPKPKSRPKPEPRPEPKAKPRLTPEQLLTRIRKKVGAETAAAAASQARKAKGAVEGIHDPAMARYQRKVQVLLHANWAGIASFRARGDLVAGLSVRLGENGEVLDISWISRSGDRFFDASVERAIGRTDPFPPPPHGPMTLSVRFDPSEPY